MNRVDRAWLSAITVFVLFFLLLGLWTLRPPRLAPEPYTGDGNLVESGDGLVPRYSLVLPPVSLSQPGRHVFSLRGLPNATWTFSLDISEPPSPQSPVAETVIEVLLVPRTPGKVYALGAPLKSWPRMPLNDGLCFRAPTLEAMRLDPALVYEMLIRVEPGGSREGNLLAAGRLDAGE